MTSTLQSSYSFAEELTRSLLVNIDEKKQTIWPAAARSLLDPANLSVIQTRFETFFRDSFPEGSFEQALALAAWMKIATDQQMTAYGLATNDKALGDLMIELLESRKPLAEIEGREDFMAVISPMRGVISANYSAQKKFEDVLTSALTPQVLPLATPQLWRAAFEDISAEGFAGSFLATLETLNIHSQDADRFEGQVAEAIPLIKLALEECSDVWAAMIEETNSSTEKRKEQFVLASAHHTALALPEVLNRLSMVQPKVNAWTDFATANALVSSDLFALEFASFVKEGQLGAQVDSKVSSFAWNVNVDPVGEAIDPKVGLCLHILSLHGVRFVFGTRGTAAAQQVITGGVPLNTHWVWDGIDQLFRKSWKAFDLAKTEMAWIEDLKGAALSKNQTQVALLRNKLVKSISEDVRFFVSRVAEAQMALSEEIVRSEVGKAFDKLPRWKQDIVCHDADVQLSSSSDAKSFARNATVSFRTTRPIGSLVLPNGAISIFDEVMLVRDNYQGGRVIDHDSVNVIEGLAKEMLKPFACVESELSFKTAPLARISKTLAMLRAGSLPADGKLEELSFYDVFPAAQRSARSDFAVQAVRKIDRNVFIDIASQSVSLKGTCLSVAGSGLTWGTMSVANPLSVGLISQVFARLLPEVVEKIAAASALQRPEVKTPDQVSISVRAADASYARRMASESTNFEKIKLDLPLVCTLASSVVVPKALQDLVRGLAFDQLRRYEVSVHTNAKVSLDAIAASTAKFIKEATAPETSRVLKALFTKSLTESDYAFMHDPYKRSALSAALQVVADMLTTVKASPVLSYYLALRVVEGL